MKKDIAIIVSNVSKSFKIYADKGNTLKEKILFSSRNKYDKKGVLKNISFEIPKGECVGLIGKNGCGKSTMLKLLTQIIYPDNGKVELSGRVSSLLELGAGFHPDLTGRENIYINASIFGLSRKEIDDRVDEIIEFSELGEYIENPVRTYSSGMYMRLAFSVAINVKADILLIDEILAVGDVRFQTKCFNKLFDMRKNGVTIVIVSHSMEQIERICDRCIWIKNGEIEKDGNPRKVNDAYLDYIYEENGEIATEIETKNGGIKNTRRGTGEARITEAKCFEKKQQESYYISIDSDLEFRISYNCYNKVDEAIFGLCIYRNDGVRCFGINMKSDELHPIALEQNGTISLIFKNVQLLNGSYSADATIEDGQGNTIDYFDNVVSFEVRSTKRCSGVTWMEHDWIIGGET